MTYDNYKGCPFWALNDTLTADEMVRQVDEFHRAGMGGFFLHARIGLITEYLGSEWMDALRAAIKRAGELKMDAWLYDEDKWPSGFAGGIVPLESEEYRGRYLGRLESGEKLPDNAAVVAEQDGWSYFVAATTLGVAWFNGTCYTDLMNPRAVDSYIRSTHEKYKEAFGDFFGNVIPGIFTDEPIMRMREGWGPVECDFIPYSPYLSERYENEYGKKLEDEIHKLFDLNPEFDECRYRYWKTAAAQFADSYTRGISEWCASNNLLLTGHFMYEDSLAEQTRWIGSTMRHYERMQIPGIDHLGLNINNIITPKQCSSMANQQGKKRVLSEMFGVSGQNMTFEDRQWIAGWHGIMGVNFICQHLSLYSLKGCRKRDYPPTFSYHQPYWEYNEIVESWQARLCEILSTGDFLADFLIIHPLETGWRLLGAEASNEKIRDLDADFAKLLERMFRAHYDFELGDEDFISREARVDKDATRFEIGEMSYSAVIVPPMAILRDSTEKLLKEFQHTGGKVIRIADPDDLDAVLARVLPRSIPFAGDIPDELWVHRRQIDGEAVYVVMNISRHHSHSLILQGTFSKFDLNTGESYSVNGEISFAPAETMVLTPADTPSPQTEPSARSSLDTLFLRDEWRCELLAPNALVLDFVEWRMDGGAWRGPDPVYAVKHYLDEEKREGEIELRYTFNSETVPQNVKLAVESPESFKRISFNGCELAFGDESYLDPCLKTANLAGGTRKGVNSIEMTADFTPARPELIDNPANRYGFEMENIYVVGDFGVYGDCDLNPQLPERCFDDVWDPALPDRRVVRFENPVIREFREEVTSELVSSGLPFHAGKILLRQTLKIANPADETLLKFDWVDAITCRIFINGTEVEPMITARPFERIVRGLLKTGNNEIVLELTNSLRNLLGPHHHPMGETAGTGPYSFGPRDRNVSPDWGIGENRAKLKGWSDTYHLVRFGVDLSRYAVRRT